MSPEERQLLQGLFDRMRPNANSPRDREAEQLIADNLRQQPYAPYLLSQTVIVQDQALQAANQRLQQLEQENQSLQQRGQQAPAGGGGFLSGLFGGGQSNQAPPQRPAWNQGGTQQGAPPSYPQGQGGYPQGQGGYPQQGGYPPPQQGYAPPQPQAGPWGGAAPAQGGGFLHGALGAAAGVAGGVLLADSMKGLFGGHNNSLGIASGVPGMGGGLGGGGETVVNNYYGDQGDHADQGDQTSGAGNADWSTDDADRGGSDDSNGSFDV